MEKMKEWFEKHWAKIFIVLMIVGLVVIVLSVFFRGVAEAGIHEWFKKPLYNLTVSDIFILLVIHACVCRFLKKENKCNCK